MTDTTPTKTGNTTFKRAKKKVALMRWLERNDPYVGAAMLIVPLLSLSVWLLFFAG